MSQSVVSTTQEVKVSVINSTIHQKSIETFIIPTQTKDYQQKLYFLT